MNDDLLITAALDDELDATASLALQRRLETEPALKSKWDEQRALRAALREKASYHAAPDDLRLRLEELMGASLRAADAGTKARANADIDADTPGGNKTAANAAAADDRAFLAEALGDSRRPHPRRRPRHELAMRRPPRPWGWAAGGAVAAMALAFALVDPAAVHLRGTHGDEQRLALADTDAGEAVSAHTRALLVDHPIEVVSSDQHTVRPWLSARLNFVPPVVDFAPQGYTLLGARRDVIAGETSAALVYRHGAHVISVFVRPATGATAAEPPSFIVIRGFNVVQRTHGGMAYCLVSDVNPKDLAALADLMTRASAGDEPKAAASTPS